MAGFNKMRKSKEGGNQFQDCSMKAETNKNIRGENFTAPAIFSLPNELLSEILSRVGARPLEDLFNARLSCKVFHEVVCDKYVLKQASLEKIRAISRWRNNSFWDKCRESGNPEALYQQGVADYFSYLKLESGFEYLHRAAKSEHLGASYVLGVILFCKDDDDESRRKGVQLLNKVYKAKGLRQCRRKFEDVVVRTLCGSYEYLEPKPNHCPLQKNHRIKKRWPGEFDDDDLHCETCTCHREVTFVCKVLRSHLVYN